MNKSESRKLAATLRSRRHTLFEEILGTEADLDFLAQDRETELEERAQEERAARLLAKLDERGKREVEEIDAALARIEAGTYGTCSVCGGAIARARIQALPATAYCIECAREHESSVTETEGFEPPPTGALPGDTTLLSDREVEGALLDLVREDGRVDTEELRIVVRHGVVYLDGAIPSEPEHQVLRNLLTDVGGARELVDRLRVAEILWERPDRDKPEHPAPALPPRFSEPASTADIAESIEEGVDFVAPGEPIPDGD